MRRILLAVAFLALPLLPAPVLAVKATPVVNPMDADLDGNGHAVYRVGSLSAGSVAAVNGPTGGSVAVGLDHLGTARGLVTLGDDGSPQFGYPALTAGTFDPSVTGVAVDAGSLYLRRVDPSHGELWFKYGPNPTDWQRVAP